MAKETQRDGRRRSPSRRPDGRDDSSQGTRRHGGSSRGDDKVTLKIPRPLYQRLATIIADTGFSSVTEFVVYVLRDLVSAPGHAAPGHAGAGRTGAGHTGAPSIAPSAPSAAPAAPHGTQPAAAPAAAPAASDPAAAPASTAETAPEQTVPALTAAEIALIRQRLRNLGYLD